MESKKRQIQLENIVEKIPLDLVLFDKDHNYLLVNKIAIKNNKIRNWIIYKNDFDYCQEFNKPLSIAESRRARFDKAINKKETIEWEESFTNDGVQFHHLRRLSPIHNSSGEFVNMIGYGIDITKQKNIELELLQAKESAEKNALSKSQFLSTMSHEIRTPLNAVIGISHILMNKYEGSEHREYLDSLHFSAQNLLNLINDILDYNKIDSGNLILEKRTFKLQSFFDHLFLQHSYKAKEKNNKLSLSIDDTIPKHVLGNETRIGQVLNNLIGNANKFTTNGNISLTLKELNKTADNTTIKFSVKDDGIGIKEENHKSIFKSFKQENTSITRQFGGTGLGLTITKKLLEIMNGTISLESTLGIGSTFSFELTLQNADKVNEPISSKKVSSLKKTLPNKRILLVEDNQLNLMIALQFLKEWGTTNITTVINGQEALDTLNKKDFDLILMDLQMPIMDGYSATENIRRTNKSIPIIALTAEAMSDVKEKIIRSGMSDYVSKPFNPDELYRVLNKYLSN